MDNPTFPPPVAERIAALHDDSQTRRKRIEGVHQATDVVLSKELQKIADDYSAMTTLPPDIARDLAHQARDAARNKSARTVQDSTTPDASVLNGHLPELRRAIAYYSDDLRNLQRETLLHPDRPAMAAALRDAGHPHLKAAVERAREVALTDKKKAAALAMAALERAQAAGFKAENRPFDYGQVAKEFLSPELAHLKAKISAAHLNCETAIRIWQGRSATKAAPPPERPATPVQKIQAGFQTREEKK